ncbi:MAG: aminodeoxychorismate/anthranilate synthase component II [Phycisphaeraceae bacterium]|nr:aminodeoxychorismate/anthranilate synthase component II [Phycisphaerales bacterium]MCB9860590.1 aminodeoxychorismate/anthranilate synthase component II [Phycisphaeraceae bacterium]
MILVIDNHDSFTWNLVHRLAEVDPSLRIGTSLVVVRNDEIAAADVLAMRHRGLSHVVLSPGPCTPDEAGASNDIVRACAGKISILGVCLGHQCIGAIHGMPVQQYDEPVHGMTSEIDHDGSGIFADIESPMIVARYHSLAIDARDVPEPDEHGAWRVNAWLDQTNTDGSTTRLVMGLAREWNDPDKQPLLGVQFHPESFMTPCGHALLANFLRMGDQPRNVTLPIADTVPTLEHCTQQG